MKFSVGDYVKLGSSPGSIDSEFKHPYISLYYIPIFLDLLMALVILLCIFRYIPTNIESQQQQCMITTQNNHYTKCDAI